MRGFDLALIMHKLSYESSDQTKRYLGITYDEVQVVAQMYEAHNDGSQYNPGFLIGVAIVFVLLGIIAGSRRR